MEKRQLQNHRREMDPTTVGMHRLLLEGTVDGELVAGEKRGGAAPRGPPTMGLRPLLVGLPHKPRAIQPMGAGGP